MLVRLFYPFFFFRVVHVDVHNLFLLHEDHFQGSLYLVSNSRRLHHHIGVCHPGMCKGGRRAETSYMEEASTSALKVFPDPVHQMMSGFRLGQPGWEGCRQDIPLSHTRSPASDPEKGGKDSVGPCGRFSKGGCMYTRSRMPLCSVRWETVRHTVPHTGQQMASI